jgi:RimJ/RimL family protein N-acetyltransferase
MPDTAFSTLETARLRLRRVRESDVAAFVAYRSQPETAHFQSWEAPFPEAEARAFLAEMADAHPDTPGQWFQFAIASREDDMLVGDVALFTAGDDPGKVELGYTLDARATGKGLAGEAIMAVLAYAFEQRGKHLVEAWTDARHSRSLALLARLGFQRPDSPPRRGFYKGEWCEDIHHTMSAQDWALRQV